jgi:Protein of unknown function (DUF732)
MGAVICRWEHCNRTVGNASLTAPMLKNLRPAAIVSSILLSTAIFPPLLSAQEFAGDRLGVCPLYNLSGYSTIDVHGNLVNLMEYCQSLSHNREARDNQFWESFVDAADDEAIAYADTVGRTDVVTYGDTVCPFLKNGGTLEELRQVQADQAFPAGFDAAVTIAAIHTYCPTYSAEMGQ